MKKVYNHSDKFYREQYEKYKVAYDKAAASLERHGDEMEAPKIKSFDFFKSIYADTKGTMVNKNKKGSVIKEIVDDQSFAYDAKVAKRFMKTIKEQMAGMSPEELEDYAYKDMTFRDIRRGKFDVEAAYDNLKKEHPDWSTAQMAAWISTNMFGSD